MRRSPTPTSTLHAPVAGRWRRLRARARGLLPAAGRREIVRFATVAGAVALILTGLAAVEPTPAYANPVTDALKDALEWLFLPGPIKNVTDEALKWLVEVPNYIERPGSMAALGHTTTAIAGASLAAIATLAVVHYWAAGVSLSDGGDPVEAVPRTVGAGIFILAWPWIFSQAVALTNSVTSILISESEIGGLAQATFVVSNVVSLQLGALIPLLLASAVVIVMIAVIFTKIALVATLAALFVGVPLAVGLYPLPSLSWVAQFALKLFVAILMIFITWALELAAIGALGKEFLTWSGGGSWVEKVTKPLIGLALLILMMSTAKHWLRVAGVLSGGGGMVRHTLAWAGTHLAFNAAAQHIPDALGGRADSIARQAANDRETAGWRQETRANREASDAQHAKREAESQARAESRKQADTIKAHQAHDAEKAARVRQESQQAWGLHDAQARQAAERQARAESAEAAGRREYGDFVAQEDRSNGQTPRPSSAASTSPAFADSNTIGNADRAYNALAPESQARVGELVHGGHTNTEIRSGLQELKREANTPMQQNAIGELLKVDSDTLGATIPYTPQASTPPPAEQPKPGDPVQQPPSGQSQPDAAQPKPSQPPTPAEPPKQP
jgi:hypothetical protein